MTYRGPNLGLIAKRRQRKYLASGSGLLPPPPSGGDLFLWRPGMPLPPFTTFTRASSASYFELEGGLQISDNRFVRYAAVDELRDNHWEEWVFDTVEPTYYRAAYLEGAGATLWTFPEDLTNAVWTKTNVAITADATAAPDEALTMDKVTETAVDDVHQVERPAALVAAGDPMSVSLFVKKAERDKVRVQIEGATTPANFAYIDVDLTPTSTLDFARVSDIQTGGVATIENISLDERINGSVRINLTVRVNGADTATLTRAFLLDDAFSPSYLGVLTEGLYMWGLQAEQQLFPTSYMADTPRARDVFFFALTTPVIKPFSLQASFIDRGTLHPDLNALIWGIGNVAGDAPVIAMTGPGGGIEMQLSYDDAVSGVIDSDVTEQLVYRSNVDLVGRFYGDDVRIEYLANGDDPNKFGTDPAPTTQPANWSNPTGLFINVDPAGGADGFISLRGLVMTSEPDFPLIPTEPPEIFLFSLENGGAYTFISDDSLDFFLSTIGAAPGYARVDDEIVGSQVLVNQAGYLKMWDLVFPPPDPPISFTTGFDAGYL